MPNLAFNAAYYLWLGINTAFGAGTITAATALATVKFIAVTAASMAASKLLAPKPPSFADSSMASRSQMVRSPISARTVAYGRSRVSGTMVYVSTTGTANEYLHIVVALAGHEIEEIEEIYFNDELVPLDPIYTNEPTGFYAGVARVNKHLGEPTQLADSDLVSDTASLVDGQWTSDHKLSGIAYVYVRLTWDTEKYPSGIPNISAVDQGQEGARYAHEHDGLLREPCALPARLPDRLRSRNGHGRDRDRRDLDQRGGEHLRRAG
jgi:hypothetical protein